MNALLTVRTTRIAFIATALIIAGCFNPALIGIMLFCAAITAIVLCHQNRPATLPVHRNTLNICDESRMNARSAMEQLGVKTNEEFNELLREGCLVRYGNHFKRADVDALALKLQFVQMRLHLSRENWTRISCLRNYGLVGFESAARRLGVKPLRLLDLIQSGRLREYRVGSGQFHAYKLDDVDALKQHLNRAVTVFPILPPCPKRLCSRDLLFTSDDLDEALAFEGAEVVLHAYARVQPSERVLPTDQFSRAEVMALKAKLDRIPLDQTRKHGVTEENAMRAVASGSIPAIRSNGVILVSRKDLTRLRTSGIAAC